MLLRSIANRTSTRLTASNLNTVNLLRTTWTPHETAVSVTLSKTRRGEERFVRHAKLEKTSSGVNRLNGKENGDYEVVVTACLTTQTLYDI